jgi:5,10-methylenetetrahydromethanopterin reductase
VYVRIGAGLDTDGTVEKIVSRARRLSATGVKSLWSSQIFGHDALSVFTVVGREVPDVELGSAVIPIHPRHPMVLANQALTVQDACGGRFVLGIGLSHQMVVEGVWGLSFDRPVRYMREYLSVLVPLLAGEQVSFAGEVIKTSTIGPLANATENPPPVIVAALGSAMLRLAGELADGTITWMTGHDTIEKHVVPTITAASEQAGRRPPRVVVCLPVCVTADPERAREAAAKTFAIYGQLPSYRAMLDKEGVSGPPDLAIVGDEEEVAAKIRSFESIGTTDLSGVMFGSSDERERTASLLGELALS